MMAQITIVFLLLEQNKKTDGIDDLSEKEEFKNSTKKENDWILVFSFCPDNQYWVNRGYHNKKDLIEPD